MLYYYYSNTKWKIVIFCYCCERHTLYTILNRTECINNWQLLVWMTKNSFVLFCSYTAQITHKKWVNKETRHLRSIEYSNKCITTTIKMLYTIKLNLKEVLILLKGFSLCWFGSHALLTKLQTDICEVSHHSCPRHLDGSSLFSALCRLNNLTHSGDHRHCWLITYNKAAQTSPHPVCKGREPTSTYSTENPHSTSLALCSAATVTTHECVASDWVEHLNEGEGPHPDLTGALNLEARLLVKGNQEVFTHEHSAADVRQTAEVLQVAPHQDGTFALLAEGPVDSQNVDVDGGPMRLMESQGILERKKKGGVGGVRSLLLKNLLGS